MEDSDDLTCPNIPQRCPAAASGDVSSVGGISRALERSKAILLQGMIRHRLREACCGEKGGQESQ
jgi:hypothetical protein